jgi:hypothetical protein
MRCKLSTSCISSAAIVNMSSGSVCDFEEGECGFQNTADLNFVVWERSSGLANTTGDPDLFELLPSIDSTYHSIEGTAYKTYVGVFLGIGCTRSVLC